jgi:hypothetical protein
LYDRLCLCGELPPTLAAYDGDLVVEPELLPAPGPGLHARRERLRSCRASSAGRATRRRLAELDDSMDNLMRVLEREIDPHGPSSCEVKKENL